MQWAGYVRPMPTTDPAFEPVHTIDGHLPLERHGLIGDGRGCALVAADGSVPWMCVPRFDDDPVFCALLDPRVGGSLRTAPARIDEARQWYEDDTAVLVTELRGPDGVVRLTDAMALREGADLSRHERAAAGSFVREVRVMSGAVELHIEVEPRGGADFHRAPGGFDIERHRQPDRPLRFVADCPLDGPRTRVTLEQGERVGLMLSWGPTTAGGRVADGWSGLGVDAELDHVRRVWRTWAGCLDYDGTHQGLVRRSAITLKLLDHAESGAIIAAATSSLPEEIGGIRNWDYRFTWVRDAAFSVEALRRVGMVHEARDFHRWILDTVEGCERPAVLYDLDGSIPSDEYCDDELSGYRNSQPVRWGNAAATQVQHDALGEIVDCGWQWTEHLDQRLPEHAWPYLRAMVEEAARDWDTPDKGIWEVRSAGQPFTYSVAMCQVALDRGARLVRAQGFTGDADRWENLASHLVGEILERSWDEENRTLTATLGEGSALDAAVLALPLRHVLPADHPRMSATVDAVWERLGAGGELIYRYDPDELDDGLEGHEGAFLLCTSWLIDDLVLLGRVDEAADLFEKLAARAGPLGLLPEQIDPDSGCFLGNMPQAFSHVGILSNGVMLQQAMSERRATAAGSGAHDGGSP